MDLSKISLTGEKPRREALGAKEEAYLVLDDGFVRLDAIYGDESDIVRRARITTYKRATKKVRPDKDLIRYLWTNEHTSPFGFIQLVFHVRAPLFVARQWFRHRTGTREEASEDYLETTDTRSATFHEMQEFSGRYASYPEEFYRPPLEQMQQQSGSNFQMRDGTVVGNAEEIRERMLQEQNAACLNRRWYTSSGLAREVARINTPLSQYTEFYWMQSLPNLLHWVKLRRHESAQWEIRAYAQVLEYITSQYFPASYRAWLETVEGAYLSPAELAEIMTLVKDKVVPERLAKKLLKGA